MADTTSSDFPKGRVAETLRKILYPDLTDHDVEAIVVCLMSHLLVEDRLNGLLYRSRLKYGPQPEPELASKAEDAMWKGIQDMGFAKKYELVYPLFSKLFPNEAKAIWEIKDIRNDIFHGRAIRNAKFNRQAISEEATVERIFTDAQFGSMQLDKFEEMMDGPYEIAESWKNVIKEWLAKRCQKIS
jgi:hypothetical protein